MIHDAALRCIKRSPHEGIEMNDKKKSRKQLIEALQELRQCTVCKESRESREAGMRAEHFKISLTIQLVSKRR